MCLDDSGTRRGCSQLQVDSVSRISSWAHLDEALQERVVRREGRHLPAIHHHVHAGKTTSHQAYFQQGVHIIAREYKGPFVLK